MFSAFSTALSALTANETAVDIIGNNLANLNTTGFKADAIQFWDLMSQQLGSASGSTDVGLGVSGAQAVRSFTQGSIVQTGGSLDAAISGDGFFVVKDSNNQQLYTRAGNFRLGSDGSLLTATGENVQGWNSVAGAVNLNAPIANIQVPLDSVAPAKATTTLSVNANLNAGATVGGSDATFSAPVEVVDTLGGKHVLTFSFTKTGANAWSYAVAIPAADLTATGTPSIKTGTLSFNGVGQLTAPATTASPIALDIKNLADGATDMTVNWNLYDPSNQGLLTQFAQTSGVSGTSQDGTPAGQIVRISLGDNGVLMANYSNGQQSEIAQVALANIRNPETMKSVGNNELQATSTTAAPAIGTADSGGRGQIMGGSLEGSTVDIAHEFTNLISMQRSYQANSKVITTSDQMLQDLIQLKQ
jgi:flagellar hook protein FlgE